MSWKVIAFAVLAAGQEARGDWFAPQNARGGCHVADYLSSMDKHTILERVKILSYRMNSESIQLETIIFGGAEIALEYDFARIRYDTDVNYDYRLEMMNIIFDIAIEINWNFDWLNSVGAFFVDDDAPVLDYLDLSGLKVILKAPDKILDMKIRFFRNA